MRVRRVINLRPGECVVVCCRRRSSKTANKRCRSGSRDHARWCQDSAILYTSAQMSAPVPRLLTDQPCRLFRDRCVTNCIQCGGVLEVVFLARIKAYRRRRRHSATRLSAFVGRRVEITTPYGNVVGMLQSVSPGYVTVTNEDGTHFVAWQVCAGYDLKRRHLWPERLMDTYCRHQGPQRV